MNQFGFIAFFYFTNFILFELRLLYNLWRNKNARFFHDPQALKKKLLQFYCIFYFFMFMSLFYVVKFYFVKEYILAAITMTWIPQIIHNAMTRNRTSLPLLYIFVISVNKVIVPVYKSFNSLVLLPRIFI